GGSGAVNAMAHVRGHRAVYDGWAAGAIGWGFADLLPYFRRSEHADGDPALRGTSGPIRVARYRTRTGTRWPARSPRPSLGSAGRPPMTSAGSIRKGWPGRTWRSRAVSGSA